MDQNHHHHADASRPSLGFPLGIALLVIVVFCLSGILSCCYHWDKIRSFRGRSSAHHHHHHSSSTTTTRAADIDDLEASSHASTASKPADPHHTDLKMEKRSESLPVLMPGDEVPRFIAMPCPPNSTEPSSSCLIVYNHIARFGVYYNC